MTFEHGQHDPVSDRAAFEAFLTSRGYAPDRASQIARKGFGAGQGDILSGSAIAPLVAGLKARTLRLLEQKMGRLIQEFQVYAGPGGGWGAPVRSGGITTHPTNPAPLRIAVDPKGNVDGPYDIKISYVSPRGFVEKVFQSPTFESVELPPNSIQEVEVRARSQSGFGRGFWVKLSF